MLDLSVLAIVAKYMVPLVFAITLHEVAHGWMAFKLGDPTAKDAGRITLNPLRHIHPVGTVLMPLLMHLANLPPFGFARPVPVNFSRLRRSRRDVALVAAAGPVANLLMLLFWLWLLVVAVRFNWIDYQPTWMTLFDYKNNSVAEVGILVNLVMMVFNLIPLIPLDGGRILGAALPPTWGAKYAQVEKYGMIILVVLLLTGALRAIIVYPVVYIAYAIMLIF
jgi:Zn-dependent protease